jgi:hypothetical protein
MSESFYDELEGLIGKHREKDTSERKEQENEARFKRLEDRFDQIGGLIEERLPKSPAAANSEASAGEEGEDKGANASPPNPPPNDPEPELNVERIQKFTVPRIYQGDDEPEIVQYVDADTGETMTRKGRRKNHPVSYNAEIVMAEPLDRPQEPEAETA